MSKGQDPALTDHDDPVEGTLDHSLYHAIRGWASMEEISRLREPSVRTPDEAVETLMRGNARFYSGVTRGGEMNAMERRVQVMFQTPFAIVLGCSDSRVPTELIFDQGFGDLFSIRVAGNVAEPATLGSIEYAVRHLRCHLIVVLGHEGCGAVKTAMLPDEERAREPEHVAYLAGHILPAVRDLPFIRDEKARMREAVMSNIRHQAQALARDTVVAQAVAAGTLRVIGAYYEIGSGA
ncbi:carbonic anhydrase, partial [Deinococcus pimensis]|uniref:carbonic anhydrase n=1 Tax=Deinococcus pimensis TaxID=309888 RepID=UPI0005EB32CE